MTTDVPVRPDLARRIVREAAGVRADFGESIRLEWSPTGRPRWVGEVPVEGMPCPVRVTYPDAYPAVPPLIQVGVKAPADCPHVIARENDFSTICWLAPGSHSPRRRWDPTRHTASTALRAAQRWGLAYLVWQERRVWPVPDAYEGRP